MRGHQTRGGRIWSFLHWVSVLLWYFLTLPFTLVVHSVLNSYIFSLLSSQHASHQLTDTATVTIVLIISKSGYYSVMFP